MAQELEIVGGKASIPAHIAKRYADVPSDIMETSISLPSLLVTGKVFTVSIASQKLKITRKDEDGEEVPRASLPVVILDYAKTRGRAYFAGAYDPDSTGAPDCFSIDGIIPDANSPDLQNDKCAGCPMATKGSRITDNNKQVAACAEQRLLAILPANKLDGSMPPLRLKLAVTSDYDGQSKEMNVKGFFAFQNYLAMLKASGVPTLRSVVTSISFDPNAAYPKLFFKAKGWLDQAECEAADRMKDDPGVAAILGATAIMPEGGRAPRSLPAPSKPAEKPADKPAAAAAKQPTKKEREAAAKAAAAKEAEAAPEPNKGLTAEEQAQMDALMAKMKGGGAAPETQTAASLDVGGDDDTGEVVAATEKPKETRKPTEPQTAKVSDDIASVLGDWD